MTARVVGRTGQRAVCVLTTRDNMTADRVVLALNERQVQVLRLDLADFPHRARLDAVLDPARGLWAGSVQVEDCLVRLEEIGALWWWHPGKVEELASPGSAAQVRWARRETAASVTGVLASLRCLHVNHPAATLAAQSKPSVLALAADCGLSVPPTWIGNDPAGAAAFARKVGAVVCKPVTSPRLHDDDGTTKAFFTQPIPATSLDASLRPMTHQVQREIPKAFEVRLTVVGTRLFPVRIDAHSAAARADYRADYDQLTYANVAVPAEIEHGLLLLMKRFGLHYASSDFIVDERGRWHLLDLNPAGQHGWTQIPRLGLDISDALAAQLTGSAPVPYG
ncbi:MvdC/MvdD family ATP grasp protein [Streptomyces spectabilis]|uniref:MvdC/MvdD family ATP grasp protein n=1 Tax=Streptomyces spectabilis TaxID=68270 RepID=UPI00340D09C2